MRKWIPILILGSAQFVMVLDSSVMNVSISQIVEDLDTTIQGVQTAITAYTLVMAAFMLLGAKLGDVWGRDRTFAIGLATYGVGSLTTALSPNLTVLLFGWSLVEGLGAVLVIPAIAALTAANYTGKERAFAYGIIGGISGIAVAVGPLIGGWVTTTLSWRYVFAAETVVVIGILFTRSRMQPAAKPTEKRRVDVVGALLSAVGLGLVVFAILKSSTWGWVDPVNPPVVGDTELTPFGFAPTFFVIAAGVAVLLAFASWERRCERVGNEPLVDRMLLRIASLRAGLATLVMQQLILLGTFFVLPVYLQVVLGLDAFETGKRLLPMSIAMLVAALAGPKIAERRSPKRVAQAGLAALAIAAFGLVGTVDVELNSTAFAVSLAVFGAGIGLLLSQLGNVIMTSVDESKTNEAGGLQGTAQNLGASLGTALIGAVLLTSLTSGFVERIQQNPALPADVRTAIVDAAAEGIDIVPVDDVHAIAVENGLSEAEAEAVASSYGEAQLDGLERALLAVAFFALVSFPFTSGLKVPTPAREAAPRFEPDARPAPPDDRPAAPALPR